MRNSSKIAIAAVLVVLGAAMLQPAQAACAAPNLITSIHAAGQFYTWSNPAWTDDPACGHSFGCYAQPFNAVGGAFWQFGTGNPAIGQPTGVTGGDNGAWPAANWLRAVQEDGVPGDGYYYANYVFTNWASPGVDGCNQPSTCLCMLLTDQWGDQGYFAMISGQSTAGADNNIGIADLILAPIPKPTITGSVRESGTNSIASIQVTVPPAPAGYYGSATGTTCNCGGNFKVFARTLPRGTQPPSDRSISTWQALNLAGGGPQPVAGTPLGGTANLRVDCGAANTDVYLGTQLVFDSGFGTQVVSQNSTKVECGPNMADPIERPKPNRPITPRTGANRGR